jgi:hypothetical protein
MPKSILIAFAYGGGGQGYGLVLEFTSCDNRAQNNIFEHLRYSMLLQSGPSGSTDESRKCCYDRLPKLANRNLFFICKIGSKAFCEVVDKIETARIARQDNLERV